MKKIEFDSSIKVNSLPGFFLKGCDGLTELDMAPFKHVTSIPWGFMENCANLKSLDFNPLSEDDGGGVELINGRFLSGCNSLTMLDMKPFVDITWRPERFLSGCSGLTSLDLSPLTNLVVVKDRF